MIMLLYNYSCEDNIILPVPPGHKVPTVQQCPGGIPQGDCRVPDEGRAAQQEGHWRLPGRGVSGSYCGGIKYDILIHSPCTMGIRSLRWILHGIPLLISFAQECYGRGN